MFYSFSSSNSSQSKSSRPKFSVFNFLDAAPFNTPAQTMDVSTPCDRTEINIAEIESPAAFTSSSTSQVDVALNNMNYTNNADDKLVIFVLFLYLNVPKSSVSDI